jgi:hypothetical protein
MAPSAARHPGHRLREHRPGTAIVAFDANGRYSAGHFAIFVRWANEGAAVLDQFSRVHGGKGYIKYRTLPFGVNANNVNQIQNFSTVKWPLAKNVPYRVSQ